MLSESETINHLNKTIETFIIDIILKILEFIQYFNFNICIIYIKFFIFTDFSSYNSLIWIFKINTFDNLTKSSFIN